MAISPFRLSMLWHQRMDNDPAHSWLRSEITHTAAKL
jgi:DNA-binding transcriptional LysR family regulator